MVRVAELGSLDGMNTTALITLFGALSGLVWSVVPGFICDLFKSRSEVIAVLIAGVLSGMAVSLLLSLPLRRLSPGCGFLLGALALPLGGFCFGVSISFVHLAASHIKSVAHIFAQHPFAPLTQGTSFAVLSVISVFAVVLFPLAIYTTFVLRRLIIQTTQHENAAS